MLGDAVDAPAAVPIASAPPRHGVLVAASSGPRGYPMRTAVQISRRMPADIAVEPLGANHVEIFRDADLTVLYHSRSQRMFVVDEALAAAVQGAGEDGRTAALQARLARLPDAADQPDDLRRDRLARLAINV